MREASSRPRKDEDKDEATLLLSLLATKAKMDSVQNLV